MARAKTAPGLKLLVGGWRIDELQPAGCYRDFPKIMGTFVGVPIVSFLVFGDSGCLSF